MPGTKVTVAMVATGAIGIGVIAYKINKFKKDYVKAREESRRRAQDRWERSKGRGRKLYRECPQERDRIKN